MKKKECMQGRPNLMVSFYECKVEPLDSCSPDLYVGHRASTASAAPKYTKGVLELGGVVLL